MKRKNLVKIHVSATFMAVVVISTFFISSLIAEIKGDETFIKTVKTAIFFSLPLLIVTMPTLAITGKQLAAHSKNQKVLQKQKRMKWIMMNGMLLILLASYLYYQSNFQTINDTFLYFQIMEFVLGISNLFLIGLNMKAGFQLSNSLKIRKNKIQNII